MANGQVEGRMKIICINCEKKCNGTAGFLRGPTLNFKSPAASSEQPGALWLMACERWCQGATRHSVTNSVEVIQSHVFGSRRHAFDPRLLNLGCEGLESDTLRWTEAMFEASCDYQMRFGLALREDIARKEWCTWRHALCEIIARQGWCTGKQTWQNESWNTTLQDIADLQTKVMSIYTNSTSG